MASQIGIVLNFNAAGATASAAAFGTQLQGVANAATTAGAAVTQSAYRMNVAYQRGIVNAVNGLQSLRYGFTAFSSFLGSQLKSGAKVFMDTETALTRLEIVMGKTGKNEFAPKLVKEFEMYRNEILRIGRDTEFTTKQAADMAIAFESAGIRGKAMLAAIQPAMAFSSASSGDITLDQSARLATVALTQLKMELKDMPKFYAMMTKAAQESTLEFSDFPQMLHSMQMSKTLSPRTKTEDFLAIASAIRPMRSPAEIGHSINTFLRNSNKLIGLFDDAATGQKTTMAGKKSLSAAATLGVDARTFLDDKNEMRPMQDVLADIAAKYQNLRNTKGPDGKNMNAKATAMIRRLFGTDMSQNLILAVNEASKGDVDGVIRTIQQMSDAYAKAQKEAEEAQEKYLKSTEGRAKIFASSIEQVQIVLMAHLADVAKDVLASVTAIVNKFSTWAEANPRFAKTLMYVTVGLFVASKVMGYFLTLLISASLIFLAFNTSATGAISGIISSAGGLGILRASLAPLGAIFASLGIALLKMGLIAAVVYGVWKTDFAGLKTLVVTLVDDIGSIIRGLWDHFSEGRIDATVWDAMSDNAQQWIRRIVVTVSRLWSFLKGFWSGFSTAITPAVVAVKWTIETLIDLGSWLLRTIRQFEKTEDEARNLSDGFYTLGQAVGFISGAVLTAFLVSKVVMGMYALYNIGLKVVGMYRVLAASGAMAALPTVGLVLAVGALVMGLMWLNDIIKTNDLTLGEFTFLMLGAASAVAFLSLALFMLGGPIALALGLLLVLGALIYQNWEELAYFWTILKQFWVDASTAVLKTFESLYVTLKSVFGSLFTWLSEKWDAFMEKLRFAGEVMQNMYSLATTGQTLAERGADQAGILGVRPGGKILGIDFSGAPTAPVSPPVMPGASPTPPMPMRDGPPPRPTSGARDLSASQPSKVVNVASMAFDFKLNAENLDRSAARKFTQYVLEAIADATEAEASQRSV